MLQKAKKGGVLGKEGLGDMIKIGHKASGPSGVKYSRRASKGGVAADDRTGTRHRPRKHNTGG